ncbi:tyrosine-type recombinase/integrase [Paraburkholderia sp. EG304]|uniref:tyrosine-type recombinase/integrase n=1 Tax=Paraburkholderia sp. EG304 TaxID=3237015 RepID=UPI00397C19C1
MKPSDGRKQLYWRNKTLGYDEAYANLDDPRPSKPRSRGSDNVYAEQKHSIDNIPLFFWPDGHYCLEASLFVYHLFTKGYSTLGGGGSLVTYAAYLSHLVRYCYKSNIDFCKMSNARFSMFMKALRAENIDFSANSPRKRRRQTIIRMGRLYLSFFDFVGQLHGITAMVESRLGGERRRSNILTRNGWVASEYWHHRSFPSKDEIRRRRPLSNKSMNALFEANTRIPSTTYRRKRRYVMLLLLRATGCRRIEVAMLRVSAIRSALKQTGDLLMLSLPNVKQHGVRIRKVPISRGDLLQVDKYIKFDRPQALLNRHAQGRDTGYLLLNERTGTPLTPNTITAEFSFIAKAAGLSGPACAHMLRHRYLVNLFMELIVESGARDTEQFQGLLFSTDTLSFKLRERSGHMSDAGVEWYTKLALSQLLHLEKSLGQAQAAEIIRSFPTSLQELELEIAAENLDDREALSRFRAWAKQTTNDISGALSAGDD